MEIFRNNESVYDVPDSDYLSGDWEDNDLSEGETYNYQMIIKYKNNYQSTEDITLHSVVKTISIAPSDSPIINFFDASLNAANVEIA